MGVWQGGGREPNLGTGGMSVQESALLSGGFGGVCRGAGAEDAEKQAGIQAVRRGQSWVWGDRSDPSGALWPRQWAPPEQECWDPCALSRHRGWAVGRGGKLCVGQLKLPCERGTAGRSRWHAGAASADTHTCEWGNERMNEWMNAQASVALPRAVPVSRAVPEPPFPQAVSGLGWGAGAGAGARAASGAGPPSSAPRRARGAPRRPRPPLLSGPGPCALSAGPFRLPLPAPAAPAAGASLLPARPWISHSSRRLRRRLLLRRRSMAAPAPAPRPPGLCCCRKGSAAGPEAPPAPPPPPEPPPDVASASSSQLFSLRHLHLGLELRPEARALAGCLVLELCALRPQPRALVLDVHPALRVLSAAFRRAAAGEAPCAFAFSPAEAAAAPAPPPPPPCPPPPPPCAPPCATSPPATATFLSAPCIAAGPLPPAAPPGDPPAGPPPAAAEPPPPLPLFAQPPCSACPLGFRVDPFTDYGSSLTVSLPAALQPHQPFQIIVRYTTADGPAVSTGRGLATLETGSRGGWQSSPVPLAPVAHLCSCSKWPSGKCPGSAARATGGVSLAAPLVLSLAPSPGSASSLGSSICPLPAGALGTASPAVPRGTQQRCSYRPSRSPSCLLPSHEPQSYIHPHSLS